MPSLLPFLRFGASVIACCLLVWQTFDPLVAFAEEVQINATTIQYDKIKQIYRYEDANLRYGQLTVDAKFIEYRPQENRVAAWGQVYFKEDSLSGSAERIELNLENDTGTLSKAWLYDLKSGYRMKAEQIDRLGAMRFVAYQCEITTCPPENPAWKLDVDELDYRIENYATSTNTILSVGPVPVIYTPWLAFPTVGRRTTGFLSPRLSEKSSSKPRFDLGWQLRLPFFWALDDDHDLTLEPRLISNRGTALRSEYNYAFTQDFSGKLVGFGISEERARNSADEIIPANDTPPESITPDRYFLDWGHNQGIGERTRFTIEMAQSSDGQVRREYVGTQQYRPHMDYLSSISHQRDWAEGMLSVSHTSEYTLESLFSDDASHSDGPYRPAMLPEFAFGMGGKLNGNIGLGGNLSARVKQFETQHGTSGRATELTPLVSLPMAIGAGWEFRPQHGRRFIAFEELGFSSNGTEEGRLEDLGYSQGFTDLELRTTLARVFPPGMEGTQQLKHRITPRLIYSETEDVAQPYAGSLSLAEAQALTFESTQKPGVVPEHVTSKLATLRFDNEWLVGDSQKATRVAAFDVVQRYNLLMTDEDFDPVGPAPNANLLETAPGNPLLPLILSGYTTANNTTFSLGLNYHHQLKTFNQRNFGISTNINPRTRFHISFNENLFTYRLPDNSTIPQGRGLSFDGSGRLSEAVSLGFGGNINLADSPSPLDRRLVSSSLTLDYSPGCYSIRTLYKESVGLAQDPDGPEYYVDKLLLITFDLGGLITGRSVTSLEE